MTRDSSVGRCRRFLLSFGRSTSNNAPSKNDAGGTIDGCELSEGRTRRMMPPMRDRSDPLARAKIILSEIGCDEYLRTILSKDWRLDFLRKATYTRIDALRRLAWIEFASGGDDGDDENARIASKKRKTLTAVDLRRTFPEDRTNAFRREISKSRIIDLEEKSETKTRSSYDLSRILGDLILRFTDKSGKSAVSAAAAPAVSVVPPKWKTKVREEIPKRSVVSRTRHLLNAVAIAESDSSRCRRIEDFLTHVDRYPDARHYAIREGAIAILLKARRIKDERIRASVREALAVLGYVDPVPGRGIRILSIDGGGMRGVLVIEMLRKLEELTGRKTHEIFDYICGVSTGAILAAALGGRERKSLDEISELYKELSVKVFVRNTIKGTGNLVWSHAYYDTALWEELLREHLGDELLVKTVRDPNAPKFSTVSAVVNHKQVMAYVFRNYALPRRAESRYVGCYKHRLWEAVRASAAAPSYFEEFKHGGFLHQDGGILVNNPCAVALHEAKLLWPNDPIECVVSFGTGRTPNHICENDDKSVTEVAVSSWKEKFYKILDSATDTEAVHATLNDLLPENVYFRFNPYLTEMLSMVEIRPEKIDQLERDARTYIRRNEEKFRTAARVLSRKRRNRQKILDWILLQKRMLGL